MRLWSRVTKAGDDECWVWTGQIDGGYGVLKINSRRTAAHRLSYELANGQIPDGLTVDHLCHTRDASCAGGKTCQHRRCVNPAHLEAVTGRENRLRGRSEPARNALKTHCKYGHPFEAVNPNRGGRACRTCGNTAQRAYYDRKRRQHDLDRS